MDVEKLIVEVRDIILRHAKPERIWLYGSRATGEATETSDVDIAFDDEEFKQSWLLAGHDRAAQSHQPRL